MPCGPGVGRGSRRVENKNAVERGRERWRVRQQAPEPEACHRRHGPREAQGDACFRERSAGREEGHREREVAGRIGS